MSTRITAEHTPHAGDQTVTTCPGCQAEEVRRRIARAVGNTPVVLYRNLPAADNASEIASFLEDVADRSGDYLRENDALRRELSELRADIAATRRVLGIGGES